MVTIKNEKIENEELRKQLDYEKKSIDKVPIFKNGLFDFYKKEYII